MAHSFASTFSQFGGRKEQTLIMKSFTDTIERTSSMALLGNLDA